MPDHLYECEWAQELSEKHHDKDTPTPHRSMKDIAVFVKKNGVRRGFGRAKTSHAFLLFLS